MSGEEEVRNGLKCDNIITKKELAVVGFYAVIIVVFYLGIVVFGVIQCCRVHKWWKVKICGEETSKRWIIFIICVISFAYICFGLAFMTFDNNWPWICFAKQNELGKMTGHICLWVQFRVAFLSLLSAALCIFCAVAAILILWELYMNPLY